MYFSVHGFTFLKMKFLFESLCLITIPTVHVGDVFDVRLADHVLVGRRGDHHHPQLPTLKVWFIVLFGSGSNRTVWSTLRYAVLSRPRPRTTAARRVALECRWRRAP